MNKNFARTWEKFLSPENLRTNLITISLFIALFELLKDRLLGRPKDFFCNGFDENGLIISEEYRTKVLSRNPSQLYASLEWWKEVAAINDADLARFERLKKHRNSLVHELLEFLTEPSKNVDVVLFSELMTLFQKIEKWWVLEVEIPTDEEFDHKEFVESEILSGSTLVFQMIYEIALGLEAEPGSYLKVFREESERLAKRDQCQNYRK